MAPALDQITVLVLPQRDGQILSEAARALGLREPKVLSPGLALEGPSHAKSSADARAILDAASIRADVSVLPREGRRKTALVCDMDSTLIGQECIDELADFAGVKDRVSEITERAMRGEIGFEGALTERVGLLKGLSIDVLRECYESRITLNSGAPTLAQTMAKFGAKTLIVSGGFTAFSEKIAKACGFAEHQANILLDDGAALLGDVVRPILGREAKLDALLKLTNDQPDTALTIGDGANDLAMIEASGLGLAYYAKPAVAAAAHSAITCTDLRTALYYQGYSEADFVEAG